MTMRFSVAFAAALLMATALTPASAADMTYERALNVDKEPQNWLLHHGNYQGHRFSKLTQINTDTVKDLKLAYTVALGGFEGNGSRYKFGNLEATPIVEDGIMYVPDGWGAVYAIDVSSGKRGTFRWKFDPGVDKAWAGDVACCGIDNRGVALWKDKIISVALDGRLFALNKATGEKVWERKIADPAMGETITMAPLVVRDLAIVGPAGGEYGIRGFVDATDLNTGQQAWRTYTIPAPGEPGSETWKSGSRWQHGGGSLWETATYDSATDTIYQGTGNAGPDFDPEYRPGDNKWAASVLALNPATGQIKWGFQYTPNDPYDFDEISEHPIIDAKINGEDRKLVVHAARNGFFYVLDRTNGSFVTGKQFVDQLNWTPGLDPKTGKPLNYDPSADVQSYASGSHGSRAHPQSERLCPGTAGGKNWEPSAYNSGLGLLYIPGIEGCGSVETVEQKDRDDQGGPIKARERFTGGPFKGPSGAFYGALKALDPTTGEIKARLKLDYANYAGALATAGGLVFLGHADGTFGAYDGKTLQELWSFNAGSGINAPPISFAVGGRQYVAVLVGSRQIANIIARVPELKYTSTASMLYVFGL
jgi:alcohol dehydrogenase (cytochrome c)